MKKEQPTPPGGIPPPGTAGAAGEIGFEAAMTRIEEIVEALEGGDLPLDASLKLFEEGIGLSRRAAELLGQAERKVELLTKSANGSLGTEPFDTSGAEAE